MVAVADGTKIASTMTFKHLTWSMQGKEFKAYMRLIPLGGCDMVLGIQWLAQLGLILSNFKNLRMEFSWNGKKMVLRRGDNWSLEVSFSPTNGEGSFACTDNGYFSNELCDEQGDNYRRDAR